MNSKLKKSPDIVKNTSILYSTSNNFSIDQNHPPYTIDQFSKNLNIDVQIPKNLNIILDNPAISESNNNYYVAELL